MRGGDPREAPRFCSQEGMFRQLFQVMSWTHRQIIPMWTEIWWRIKKEKIDVATGRTWTSFEWCQGAWHVREYTYIQIYTGRVLADLRGRRARSQRCHRLAG